MRLETVEIGAPQSKELVMRVRQTGVCATDMRTFQAGSSTVKPPVVLGHEVSGEIAAAGDEVTELKVGDRVSVAPNVYCGQCVQCRSGSDNMCENISTLGYNIDGGYSEYLRLPRVFLEKRLVYKLPDQISLEEAALVEPLSCCYRGLRRAHVDAGKTVLVVGDGPIGMMHLLLAKSFGSKTGMSGLIDRNLRLADSLGADFTIDASKDATLRVKNETGERGADVVIVAVSSPSVIEEAMTFVSKRGTLIIFGGCAAGSRISVDPNQIHYGEVTISGSTSYSYADYQECFKIVAEHRIRLEPIITNRYPLEQIEAAFEAELKGQTVKTMIVQ